MSNTFLIWEAVKGYGYKMRKQNLDGLASWNNLKLLITPYSQSLEWKPSCLTYYNQLIELGVKENQDSDMSITEWEQHHFILQHGRIPFRSANNGDIVRLLQISYNAGQFSAEVERCSYNDKWMRYYDENRLDQIRPRPDQHICR
jgi:hypothetical protein